ncbi:MAG: TrkA family potassium uptake protein [Actinobacteria bacterium]|nr:TrkA family potassium uptake protein [Actinomycetota bacterium]
MYAIIAGGGKVGSVVARDLIAANYEVVVLEENRRKAQELIDELGGVVIPHDASEGRWLLEAGITRADLLIAVTGDDEDNLIISQLGRALSHDRVRTIARINNPKNSETFRLLGIESIVNATDLVMSTIERDVSVTPVIHLMRLGTAGLELVEMAVAAGSAADGATLGDLRLRERGGAVSLILRDNRPTFPSYDTVLRSGDLVVAIIQTEREQELRVLFSEAPVERPATSPA